LVLAKIIENKNKGLPKGISWVNLKISTKKKVRKNWKKKKKNRGDLLLKYQLRYLSRRSPIRD